MLFDPNWRDAMYDKYNALIKNSIWILVPRPPNVNVGDSFSLVVKPSTIRTVLSLALSRNWPIHQLDVKNAFLNGDLSETVYSINHQVMLRVGFCQGRVIRIISSLHKEFDMTDLGALNYFLGISVTRDSKGIFLSQKKYALELLDRAHMANCNPTRTPVDTKSKLGSDGDPISDPTMYRSLASGLQYLTFTRPDISYAVQVCLHMHDPREPHFAALKRVLRYVRGTLDFGLHLDNLISWSSKRQQTLSRSSAEAEYRGVSNEV
ncbi:ribonuclease H-like domain-containing protein [Tanacetum coccineum]